MVMIISDNIHEKFLKFGVERDFKHHFVLIYLFLYRQSKIFKIPLHKQYSQGKTNSIIHWTSLVRKTQNNFLSLIL